jgi:primosomal protein N' (replication factor Y)
MTDLVADIAVGISVNKTFRYHIPEEMHRRLVLGARVLIPFGSRRIVGTVLGFSKKTDAAGLTGIKSIIEIVDNPLMPELLTLARWMSDYYMYPLGQTIESLVPKAVSRAKPKKKKYVRLMPNPRLGGERGKAMGRKQTELVRLLTELGEMSGDELRAFPAQTIRSLCNAGIIEIVERETLAPAPLEGFTPSTPPVLMTEQAWAVQGIAEAVAAKRFEVFLLHGVTGSGKTEVYLQIIARLANTGSGSIVLVPEIALTPQLLERFRGRFGNRVAVLHSGLTDRERADEYRRIQAGQVDVVVGARSAIFAPFKHIGLIIVDEEHENSYKQDEGLRYHARDVAVMRAKIADAVAVLGSATPSLESYYNAKSGKYHYLHMPTRVDHRPMPAVAVVDLKVLPKNSLYSPVLVEKIRQRLEKSEQVLLLLNRRGFSSVLICGDCGEAVKCPNCSVSLTFHKAEQKLKCHYCGYLIRPPDLCPSCSSIKIKLLGSGTQKIEEELKALFPGARIRRLDSDTAKGRQAYDTLLRQVDRQEVDILLGTQMVAKGHDFPLVTLVGVVDADVGLNLPDFRSSEKTFQLITQAAGRAGRGETTGEVIIQTINPHHYSIRHSRTHDYEGFYDEEIAYRRELGYPPVGRIVKLELKSAKESHAAEAAKTAQNRIRSLMRGKETMLLGPAPAPIAKVRGQYRFQLLLLSQKRDFIRSLAAQGRNAVEEKFGRKCKVIVDVDPINLM